MAHDRRVRVRRIRGRRFVSGIQEEEVMRKKLSAEVLQVTKALAKKFDEMSAPPYDRPLSERRMMLYERIVRADDFRSCTWASAVCKETGETYRVNGKHTSRLFCSLEPFPLDLFVTVERWSVDTLQEVAKLYASFDAGIASRNSHDINTSFAKSTPELASVSVKIINVCVTGISIAKINPQNYSHIPMAERAEMMLDYIEWINWVAKILHNVSSAKPLLRGGVAGAMLLSWEKSKKSATEFWEHVRDEDSPSNRAPDRQLAKWLVRTSVDNGRGAKHQVTATAREFFVRSIHAWNAWRDGNELQQIKYHPGVKPPSVK
jgi:hypothetical protein